jgi:hypothetical protein
MKSNTDFNITRLVEELDAAVALGDVQKADEIADMLFRLQGGAEADTVMPAQFPAVIGTRQKNGGQKVKSKNLKKLVGLAAAAALVMALGITALATDLFGIGDLVIGRGKGAVNNPETITAEGSTEPTPGNIPEPEEMDLIVLQGYPDSNEYKASEEWNIFYESYDQDGSIVAEVGNKPNEFTEKYPMYLCYSQEMADKLEEIIAKYNLQPHEFITIAESEEQLFSTAGTGNFLDNGGSGVNRMLGGYVYNDGTFHYDGEATLFSGASFSYQFENYVKGTFSDTCLNVGDADSYQEWQYETKSGVTVSLALGDSKALVIADLENSFLTVNVLTGTGGDGSSSSGITKEDLQNFADLFDFNQINSQDPSQMK